MTPTSISAPVDTESFPEGNDGLRRSSLLKAILIYVITKRKIIQATFKKNAFSLSLTITDMRIQPPINRIEKKKLYPYRSSAHDLFDLIALLFRAHINCNSFRKRLNFSNLRLPTSSEFLL